MFRLTSRIGSTAAPLGLLSQQFKARSTLVSVSSVLRRHQSDCSNKSNVVNIAKLAGEDLSINTILYTTSHEWLAYNKETKLGFIGVTQYAANHMGDVTYVELSDKDEVIEAGESFGSIESVKSSNEIYTPYEVEIVENNMDVLNENPQLVSNEAMGEAWLLKVKVLNENSDGELMSLEQYETYLKETEE